MANLGHFFHGKCFVYVKIVFFRLNFGKILPEKESTASMRGVLLHLSFSGLSSGKPNLHGPLGAQFSVVYFDRFT
jgi:hypothetical protein